MELSKILSVATAPAQHRYESAELLSFMDRFIDDPIALRKLKFIWRESGIQSKHSVLPDFKEGHAGRLFTDLASQPTTKARMDIFESESLALGSQVASKAISDAHIRPDDIDAIITVSCTGMSAPGLEIQLAESLGLRKDIDRHAVNFMGCYAAFHGMRLADLICQKSGAKRVLVVCVELCSLHFRNASNDDNLLSTTLFSDGAAAMIVGSGDCAGGMAEMHGFHSVLIPEGKEDMAWCIGNTGFEMVLNKNVPKHIEQNMSTALAATLNRHAWERSDIDSCAIHPGGKNVLGAFTNALEADQESIQPSFDILSKYGNMSSCSVVFVLEQILREKRSKSGIYAAAFGPGLTVESAILKAIH